MVFSKDDKKPISAIMYHHLELRYQSQRNNVVVVCDVLVSSIHPLTNL